MVGNGEAMKVEVDRTVQVFKNADSKKPNSFLTNDDVQSRGNRVDHSHRGITHTICGSYRSIMIRYVCVSEL